MRSPLLDSKEALSLAKALQAEIRGEVRFDDGSRALYSTDASNYRQLPIGVVIPRDEEDVVRTLAIARGFGAPILARGAGTSEAGQSCNTAVVIDFSKYMNRVLELAPDQRVARVQPGLVLDDLRDAAGKFGLTFGPDPASHNRCTLGGMIGNNSCGVHSIMSGLTSDNVLALDILTYDGVRMNVGRTDEDDLKAIIHAGGRRGEIYSRLKELRDRFGDQVRRRYPQLPRRISGFPLDQLLPENSFDVARSLVGTEGTCVTVLEATVGLIPNPPARIMLVLGYHDVYEAAEAVPELMAFHPTGLEGFDDRLVYHMRKKNLHLRDLELLPEGAGWLLVEFGGANQQEASDQAAKLASQLRKTASPPSIEMFEDHNRQERMWTVRESGLGATSMVPGEPAYWSGWEDSAVPPEKFGSYLRELRALMDQYHYSGAFYGHFGQGCLHTRMDFDLRTKPGIEKFRNFMNDAADLVVSYGGALSGEHGDGQARAELLPKMYGAELVAAFREFKTIWDPKGRMNPGKVVEPYRLDENLRLGEGYSPAQLETNFQFPNDEGSFANAALRCVGVGKCRRLSGGTMCPSFMVTREEEHSTRGRARLLFEMMQREVKGKNGWRHESVKESLDLCFACKACKSECPVRVDMATYKAEFMSHYYQGRLRPISAYAFGFIYRWAQLGSIAPTIANLFSQNQAASLLIKKALGIAPERRIPAFATETFRAWFRKRQHKIGSAHYSAHQPRGQVILWSDTFNNYFTPEPPKAAVKVLEAAGYEVIIPRQRLCCGRPLYDYGFIDHAKNLLRRVLRSLTPEIEAAIPVVGLEPSCIAVFRDELLNLFPNDEMARRLSKQSFLLSEFLANHDYSPPRSPGQKAIVHGHCHQKALIGMDGEATLLQKMGLDFNLLDSGCCGMAGAFGFEQGEHYDISIKAGERVLLPAVRTAPDDCLIIADGFSCREQIVQTTNRKPLHLAQVLQLALQADSPNDQ